jgi:hypothetical protein
MADEAALHERLREIEWAYAGSSRRDAGHDEPKERLRARLQDAREKEPEVEFRLAVSDEWAQQLLAALCDRCGVEVFRYRGQRRTSAMVKAPRSFIEQTLWPMFEAMQHELRTQVQGMTLRAMHALDCPGARPTDATQEAKPAVGRRS